MQGKLSVERMCQLAGVSRAGFYRSLQERDPVEEDMEVQSTIQKIFAEHKRRYGYRRVSAELLRPQGSRLPATTAPDVPAAGEPLLPRSATT